MIQIRQNIFETNSSSSHALVIFDGIAENSDPKRCDWHISDKTGKIYIYEDDITFGRYPFDLLTDWYRRMCYAIASYAYDKNAKGKRKEIESMLRKRYPHFKEIEYPVTWQYDSKKDEEIRKTFYGYVDHQSDGMLQSFLKKYDVSLEDFIFDDRYMVVIDGDEYNVFDRVLNTPAWNDKKVKVVYDTMAQFYDEYPEYKEEKND
jgi:hypothetical protein